MENYILQYCCVYKYPQTKTPYNGPVLEHKFSAKNDDEARGRVDRFIAEKERHPIELYKVISLTPLKDDKK
jgi:hypothetical protein